MILVDTNVVSQTLRANGDARVNAWLSANFELIGIPTLAISEIVYGIEMVDDFDRRVQLTNALATLRLRIDDRYVPFDTAAAEAHGWLKARMRRAGTPMPEIDSQIAAIAMSRNAILATRNVKDFERTGIEILNPWDD